ncbi:MAG: DUF72 domain-containing protein [Thermoleophilia bacterium]|nr:DUF72 domain-containing protein [Thermoleophilia bacterium]
MKGGDWLWVGTSGWHYDHWRGPLYPEGLASKDMLAFYAEHFRTVEINSSFYRLPAPETLDRWGEAVPAGFVFSVKASRYLTHMKKLKDPEQGLDKLLSRVERLGDRLGPILFQLPPRWRVDVDRLDRFLSALCREHRYAFEFRDASWFDPRVYRCLARHDAAFCIYELAGESSPREVTTTDFVYVRLHGPGAAYQGRYDTRTLAVWAGKLLEWAREGRRVFCYFDNDEAGHAPLDALRLRGMLESF